jgi:hypothetical protein
MLLSCRNGFPGIPRHILLDCNETLFFKHIFGHQRSNVRQNLNGNLISILYKSLLAEAYTSWGSSNDDCPSRERCSLGQEAHELWDTEDQVAKSLVSQMRKQQEANWAAPLSADPPSKQLEAPTRSRNPVLRCHSMSPESGACSHLESTPC